MRRTKLDCVHWILLTGSCVDVKPCLHPLIHGHQYHIRSPGTSGPGSESLAAQQSEVEAAAGVTTSPSTELVADTDFF